MKLKSCKNHPEIIYTLKSLCPSCNLPVKEAHYKFIKIKDVKDVRPN